MTPTTTTQMQLSGKGASAAYCGVQGSCNCDGGGGGGGGGPSMIDFDHSYYTPSLHQFSSSSSLEMARHSPTTTNIYQYPSFLPVYSATPPSAVTPPSPPVTSQFPSQSYPSYYSHVVSRESGQFPASVPPPTATRLAQSPSPSVTTSNFTAIPPQLRYSQTTLTGYVPLNTSMTKWNLNIEAAGNGISLGSPLYTSATRSPVSGIEPIPPPPPVPVEAQFLEASPPHSPKETIELVLASQHFDLQPSSLEFAETCGSCSKESVVTSEKVQEGDALSKTPSKSKDSTSAIQKSKRRRKRVKSKKETRKRMVWTEPLRERFLKALDQLGTFTAMPKDILKVMDVPGLTRENISSHLQKYRIKLEKEQALRHTNTNSLEHDSPTTREDLLGELQFEAPASYAAALAAPGTAVMAMDSFTIDNDTFSSLLSSYHPSSSSSSAPPHPSSPVFSTHP